MSATGLNLTTYNWDYESRLTSITRPGTTTSAFGYNGLDTRVSKTDSGGSRTFARDGAYVTDPVTRDTVGATTTKYTPGISEQRSGTSRYLHSGLKNADARTTTGSSLESTRTYDAFGNVTGTTGTWQGFFGYAGAFGYQEDADYGLKLLGHRYLDSSTGSFLSRDPNNDGRNWFSYCSGNPLHRKDPKGLDYLVFDGDNLILRDDNGNDLESWPACSGQPGSCALDVSRTKYGPIPEGEYFIDVDEIGWNWTFGWAQPGPNFTAPAHSWGAGRVTIHPTANANTFGRGGFFLHGGFEMGSAGCIDVGHAIEAVLHRIERSGKKKKRLKLFVKYKDKRKKVPGTKSQPSLWPRQTIGGGGRR